MKYRTFFAVMLFLGGSAPAQSLRPGAPLNLRDAADFARILASGARPWEVPRPAPLIVEEHDGRGELQNVFYFSLEAADLNAENLRLPSTARERAFVRAVDVLQKRDGPAGWPIVVLSAPDRLKHAVDMAMVATTRRIILRRSGSNFQPAAAIVLNSAYWSIVDIPPDSVDRELISLVAGHELYHARRVWLRAQEIDAHAGAIESRFGAGCEAPARTRLEPLISEAIAAQEEIDAVDRSLHCAVASPARRVRVLEYREMNRLRYTKALRSMLAVLPIAANTRPEAERWLGDLLKRDLCPK